VARELPKIKDLGAAFRFALEAEQACADLAAEADVLSPDGTWHDKLEEVVCTHDDRVQKLSKSPVVTAGGPAGALDGDRYAALTVDPAPSWPAVVEQLIAAQEAAAQYLDDFAAQCGDALGSSAALLKKSAQQDRASAAELRGLLG